MSKFHINKNGVPAPCRATKGNCPYGGADGNENHYDSQEEAQAAANEMNAESYNMLPNVKVSPKVQSDFIENVYYPANSTESLDFAVTMDESLDDSLEDSNDPESIKGVFKDNFNDGAVIAEIKTEDPIDYTLNSTNDGLNVHAEMIDKIKKQGYDTSVIEKEDGEYSEDFANAYRGYLSSKQGPVKEVFGKNMAEIENPNSLDTKQFYQDFIERHGRPNEPSIKVTPEMERDFKDNAYYPASDPNRSNGGYITYTEAIDDYGDWENTENEDTKDAFKETFGSNTIVAEIESEDPMKYSLDSSDDNMASAHSDLIYNLDRSGKDTSPLFKDKDNFEFTDDFREKYGSYLKSKQGPVKELYGKKFAEIENPDSDSTRRFFESYLDRRSK